MKIIYTRAAIALFTAGAACCFIEIANRIYENSFNSQLEELVIKEKTDRQDPGKILKENIDKRFEYLVSKNLLKSEGNGINDIFDVLKEQIAIGDSIDTANKIIVSAGFKLTSINYDFYGKTGYYAEFRHFKNLGIGDVTVYIWLDHEKISNEDRITSITCRIVLQYP